MTREIGGLIATARARMHAGARERHFATGKCASLAPGLLVDIVEHPDAALNGTYAVLGCRHDFGTEPRRSEDGALLDEPGKPYSGEYELLHIETPYAPPITAPKPRLWGPQTAIVVGEGEIDCDEYGRILVRFHWDREGQNSMRCRVSQPLAGHRWGNIVVPRVGMEVIVVFLDGDPDRPLVTGCVYNASHMPPFGLPDTANTMGLKSQTVEGQGYNELVLDDTAGKEGIRLHAQKDMNSVIENDVSELVKHDKSVQIDNDEFRKVGNDMTVDVASNHSEKIGANQTIDVESNRTATIKGNDTVTLPAGALTHSVGSGAVSVNLGMGPMLHNVGVGSYSCVVGAGVHTTQVAAGNLSANVNGEITQEASGKITIDSTTEIELKVGSSTIQITPSAIVIRTGELDINSGTTKHIAMGEFMIDGMPVKINT